MSPNCPEVTASKKPGAAHPERAAVTISSVQRNPRHPPPSPRRREPLGQQRRLTEPSRRGQKKQPPLAPAFQPVSQPRPCHHPAPQPRHVKLRLQQHDRHPPSLPRKRPPTQSGNPRHSRR